jgi:hypothetical protein
MAWDDIDTDPTPGADPVSAEQPPATRIDASGAIDEIAVERAMDGDHVTLTRAERDEAVRRLTARGLSVRQIAERLRIRTGRASGCLAPGRRLRLAKPVRSRPTASLARPYGR